MSDGDGTVLYAELIAVLFYCAFCLRRPRRRLHCLPLLTVHHMITNFQTSVGCRVYIESKYASSFFLKVLRGFMKIRQSSVK